MNGFRQSFPPFHPKKFAEDEPMKETLSKTYSPEFWPGNIIYILKCIVLSCWCMILIATVPEQPTLLKSICTYTVS